MSVQTDPTERARLFPEVVTGRRINDVLGEVTPDQAPWLATPSAFYSYHHGDVFFPGAPGWVLDQKTETPLMCQWGNGLLLAPNRGFQAYPPVAPYQTPANLVRLAAPWGTFSPEWGVPIVQEHSRETQDTAGFNLLPNYNFTDSAPQGSVTGPNADYGGLQGIPGQNPISPIGATGFGATPLGVTSSPAFEGSVYVSDDSQAGPLPAGGVMTDY
jgi:hypothetical protein